MPEKGRTNRTKKRKSRANRTRLSGKAPTGKDKPTSRKTSGDTLKTGRIKRIISHPERRKVPRKRLRVTARNRRKKPLPEEEGYVPTPEELEEEEELGAYYPDSNPDFATGYTFEDLKKVHRVITTDDADEQEKQQAREVLPAVMGSDVWDEMLDEFEGARQRVARLMNNSNV